MARGLLLGLFLLSRLAISQAIFHSKDLSEKNLWLDQGLTRRLCCGVWPDRVPLHWYDEYDHIGYNVKGEKVMKSKGKDGIDQALAR
jgi:hypothetical protein